MLVMRIRLVPICRNLLGLYRLSKLDGNPHNIFISSFKIKPTTNQPKKLKNILESLVKTPQQILQLYCLFLFYRNCIQPSRSFLIHDRAYTKQAQH